MHLLAHPASRRERKSLLFLDNRCLCSRRRESCLPTLLRSTLLESLKIIWKITDMISFEPWILSNRYFVTTFWAMGGGKRIKNKMMHTRAIYRIGENWESHGNKKQTVNHSRSADRTNIVSFIIPLLLYSEHHTQFHCAEMCYFTSLSIKGFCFVLPFISSLSA